MKSILALSLLGLTFASQQIYKGQKVYTCKVNEKSNFKAFDKLDVWEHDINNLTFTVRIETQGELDVVSKVAQCKVAIENIDAHIAKYEKLSADSVDESSRASLADPFFNNYQSYATIKSTLQQWATANPTLATFIPSIGKSVEGRDIFAFVLTNKATTTAKKGIWFNGGIHAREWISPAANTYVLKKLLEDANTSAVKTLLDTFEFHFTPVSNPDGYEYSRSGDRLWRKNRSKNSGGSYGVDLNRNWNDHWGVSGSSTNPNDETYQGRSPASEPETQALAAYALSIPNRYGGIDFHSYGQLVLRNWGWSTRLSANEQILKTLGDSMKQAFASKGYTYSSITGAQLYPASGCVDDWMASVAKLVSYTFELCPTSGAGFQLPASEIVKCSEGAYAAVLVYANFLKANPNIPANRLLA